MLNLPRKNVEVKDQIRKALKNEALTWGELLERTDVSSAALSKHLNDLLRRKEVKIIHPQENSRLTYYELESPQYVDALHFVTTYLGEEKTLTFVQFVRSPLVLNTLLGVIDDIGLKLKSEIDDKLEQGFFIKSLYKKETTERQRNEETIATKKYHLEQFLGISAIDPYKEFSVISIDIAFQLYNIEKTIISVFPKDDDIWGSEITDKLVVHSHLKKARSQDAEILEKWDKFHTWWLTEVKPILPSPALLGFFVLNLFFFQSGEGQQDKGDVKSSFSGSQSSWPSRS